MRAIERHRTAVEQFFKQVLGPRDRAFLVTVGADVKLVTDLTGSLSELERGVRNIDAPQSAGQQLGKPCVEPKGSRGKIAGCGGTALWNAVYSSAKLKLEDVAGRKALIVLSDGMDLGSSHSLPEAIEVAQSADTLVYTIHSAGMPMVLPFFKLRGKQQLNRLAVETGARAFSDPKEHAADVYAQIDKELRSVYVLGFAPPAGNESIGRHKMEVKVARKGVTVRSRQEYSVPVADGAIRTR
jgi:VWFA-related protein